MDTSMEIHYGFTFDAAHKLTRVGKDHKCANLHGHTFEVFLYVRGPVTETRGWVVDFADIKKTFAPILSRLDHHYLNEIPGLQNPTSENIAKWIWRELRPQLPILTKVLVKESLRSGAEYHGQNE